MGFIDVEDELYMPFVRLACHMSGIANPLRGQLYRLVEDRVLSILGEYKGS